MNNFDFWKPFWATVPCKIFSHWKSCGVNVIKNNDGICSTMNKGNYLLPSSSDWILEQFFFCCKTVRWIDRPCLHPTYYYTLKRANAVWKTVYMKYTWINKYDQSKHNVVDIFNFSGSASLSPSLKKAIIDKPH